MPSADSDIPRILIVDDEMLTAHAIENAVRSKGWDVAGPADEIDQAVIIAGSEQVDAAVLDLNIEGRLAWPIAAILKDRGIPFLFLTGYAESQVVHPDYQTVPTLGKPFLERELIAHLTLLLAGPSAPPAPVNPIEGD